MNTKYSEVSVADQVKHTARTVSALFIAMILCAALQGCATCPVAKIQLYPETLGVETGQTVVLKASPSPFRQEGWHYQWQRVVDQDTNGAVTAVNIPEARCAKLVLRNVQLEAGQLYRCMIYKDGKLPETNFTAIISLHVSSEMSSLHPLATVTTTVSGTLQPGGNWQGSSGCCPNTIGMVFTGANGWWWPAHGHTATITDQSNVNYSKYPTTLEVIQNTDFNYILCQPLPLPANTHFSVGAQAYIFCLHFPGRAPVGQTFKFTITWQ